MLPCYLVMFKIDLPNVEFLGTFTVKNMKPINFKLSKSVSCTMVNGLMKFS